MKYPLIREIQLGKSIEEFIEDHLDEYELLNEEIDQPKILMEVIRIDKPTTRFAVVKSFDHCGIILLDPSSKLQIDYWGEDGPLEDEAHHDCKVLNKLVERLYGTKRKKPKPKLTQEQFGEKKGRFCPYCGNKAFVLDEITWKDHDEMGCKSCGETWRRNHKVVVIGFS